MAKHDENARAARGLHSRDAAKRQDAEQIVLDEDTEADAVYAALVADALDRPSRSASLPVVNLRQSLAVKRLAVTQRVALEKATSLVLLLAPSAKAQ